MKLLDAQGNLIVPVSESDIAILQRRNESAKKAALAIKTGDRIHLSNDPLARRMYEESFCPSVTGAEMDNLTAAKTINVYNNCTVNNYYNCTIINQK